MSAKLPTGSVKMTAALGACRRAGGIHKGSAPEEALNCLICRDVSREHQREETGKGEPVNHTVKLGFITQAAIKKKKKSTTKLYGSDSILNPNLKSVPKKSRSGTQSPATILRGPAQTA